MIYIGIDPGSKSGAIAILYPNGEIEVFDFLDEKALNTLRTIFLLKRKVVSVLELVHAMPKQGVTSAFNFGAAYGEAKRTLEAFKMSMELVTPQKWQKKMYPANRKLIVIPKIRDYPKLSDSEFNKFKQQKINERKKAAKEYSLNYARKLFPKIASVYLSRKMDHNRAEALILAEYCRLTHSGEKQTIKPNKKEFDDFI